MSDWEQQFAAMQQQFFARARERIALVQGLLSDLSRDPSSKKLLQEARHHFHWLSGVGGTYKMPELSYMGTTGEEICDRHLEAPSAISNEDVMMLMTMANMIQDKLEDRCR